MFSLSGQTEMLTKKIAWGKLSEILHRRGNNFQICSSRAYLQKNEWSQVNIIKHSVWAAGAGMVHRVEMHE